MIVDALPQPPLALGLALIALSLVGALLLLVRRRRRAAAESAGDVVAEVPEAGIVEAGIVEAGIVEAAEVRAPGRARP